MTSDLYTHYESWDLATPIIPPRSRLYHLKPAGIGTHYVESLTGYICRLAEAHCVSTDALFSRELIPSFIKPYWNPYSKRVLSPTFSSRTKALNAIGLMAADWVETLQRSTLREDLRFLTMLTWANVLSQRHLIRPVKAWCPACYEFWRENRHIVYEPLLWALMVVKVCSQHGCRLKTQCDSCNRQSPLLGRHARPGYCSRCKKWMGTSISTNSSNDVAIRKEELNIQLWITTAVGELLAAAPSLPNPPPRIRAAQMISDCINQFADGVSARFASLLKKRKSIIWGWQNGQTRIPLEDLLQLCFCIGKSPLELLTSSTAIKDQDTLRFTNSLYLYREDKKPRRTLNKDSIRRSLEETLNEWPPPPMYQVARRLDCDNRSLYNHFPDLCHHISSRCFEYRKESKKAEIEECRKAVREAALKLHHSGLYPSKKRVKALLDKPGCIEVNKGYDALVALRPELGMVQRY